MTIATGTRLGPYEIVSPLGAGGMGEVWKARDTRLDRSVAIKVLPADFAQNAQLKLRFEREAKTISQLNHPNICTLYDVGDGYLVMELLQGESLADRIARGPLPISETLRIGAQIADALDRAHRAGIVHRDLKPGNIMLTKSGAKLLDFGLAKTNPVLSSQSSVLATEHKPLTQEGTILGTFQYMAPEQLEGLEADGRTDIFALGAVLYEMATGRRAFSGTSKTSLIAAIVSAEPQPISTIQPLTPPAFEHVVKKCLAKDREVRWQSAHDVAEELRWIGEAGSQAGVASPLIAKQRHRQRASWAIALLAVAAIAWFASARWTRDHQPSPLYRLTITTPPGSVLGYQAGSMVLSPDARTLAYASYSRDGYMLAVRKLSETTWHIIDGTTDARVPFWSPDGRQIGYTAHGALWKVSADGNGAPEEITRLVAPSPSATWSADGTIVFASAGKLFRVSASGGDAVPLRAFPADALVASVQSLPDGRHLIAGVSNAKQETTDEYVVATDEKDPPKRLLMSDNNALYADGFLFFVRGGTLYAQPFDPARFVLSGQPAGIAKVQGFAGGTAYFSAVGDTLVYLPQGSEVRTELQRVDRTGKPLATIGAPAFFFSPRISHDGKRVAVDESATNGNGDVWIFDVATGGATRASFAPENESAPVWGPGDAEIVYFQSLGHEVLLRKRLAGGEPSLVYQVNGGNAFPGDWSPDGRTFLVQTFEGGHFHLQACSTADWTAVDTGIVGRSPRFSPDGRWIAYVSAESPSSPAIQVFVQPFPTNGSKWQVSSDGGVMPVWRKDGKAISFVSPSGKMMESAVSVGGDGSFVAQAPQPLFGAALREGGLNFGQYDVFPDGTFLLNRIPDTATTPMTIVIHWKEALGK